MSRILALDTSTDACSVALLNGDELTQDFRIEPRRHTHLLLPMVQSLLASSSLRLEDLDAIAFGRGPGSFAGIRIATGVAQGLGLAADLPLIPVSTLAAMAITAQPGAQGLPILTALDARMNEVYWALIRFDESGMVYEVEERVSSPRDVSVPSSITQVYGVGSGWVYAREMESLSSTKVSLDQSESIYPTAASMLTIAKDLLLKGQVCLADEVRPVYLRDDVAWKKKDQQ
ncbi:tRNA (adenosine(37)-N6)-threonylcarbamoyltransferase complex dimerization subunit type 1 TsaB [Nitrincola tibetensis]|uniref:tRNA threonylcarbamoyladenosine biosynthesis protein TsaB n=1 Tax=Nitrincola tibetensis TaxID=2219697 RepID=A0A364NL60_9GAMM|nr:tRNA (adenosine(37)-N6)-threonylcarbamoyltransferase complex dimerization subunit type 1 TsaB [Nitrincola tibetensis]RAU17802.1 tRNA (adenosine(37)-N6)-threonylcarbamoyltransferase complex dimerization subunit type 1 TsaB [Nitrincola tibetensis]